MRITKTKLPNHIIKANTAGQMILRGAILSFKKSFQDQFQSYFSNNVSSYADSHSEFQNSAYPSTIE